MAIEKKTKKLVLSVFGGHIGGLVVAIFFCFAAASFMSGWGLFLCVPLMLLFYSFGVYGSLWGAGHEDQNSANFGHIVLNRKRGFLLGLMANSLNILFGLVFLVCFFLSRAGVLGSCGGLIVAYKLANAEIWPVLNAMELAVAGKTISDFTYYTVWQAAAAALLPLLPVLISGFAYFMGTRDISLTQKLIYKKKQPGGSVISGPQKAGPHPDGKPGKAWVTPTDSDVQEKEKSSLLKKILYQNDDSGKKP